jgi:hypothetical protein
MEVDGFSEKTIKTSFFTFKLFILFVLSLLFVFVFYLWFSGNYCYFYPDVIAPLSFSHSTMQDSCFHDLANGRFKKNCERVSHFVSSGVLSHYELDKCYERVIGFGSDSSVCLDLNPWDAKECITRLAMKRGDSSICNKYSYIFDDPATSSSVWNKYPNNYYLYSSDLKSHAKNFFSFPGCLISSGADINYDFCNNLSKGDDKVLCYEFVAIQIKTVGVGCESILNVNSSSGEVYNSYLECLKSEAQKNSNLSICQSCEGKDIVGCNENFIADCYAYSGLMSGKVEPCFYKNNLFSVTYNSSWNYFLDCYMDIASSGSSPFNDTNPALDYLKNYCSALVSDPEKYVCDATVGYLSDHNDCINISSDEYSFDKNKFDSCMDSVVLEKHYYDYYYNVL